MIETFANVLVERGFVVSTAGAEKITKNTLFSHPPGGGRNFVPVESILRAELGFGFFVLFAYASAREAPVAGFLNFRP